MLLMFTHPTGSKVKVIYNGEVIDEAIIVEVGEGFLSFVEIDGSRGKTKFVLCDREKNEWKMLFLDPYTNTWCYSEKGSVYTLEVI